MEFITEETSQTSAGGRVYVIDEDSENGQFEGRPLKDKFECDYEVLKKLGHGNFGQVFKAKNKRNGKI